MKTFNEICDEIESKRIFDLEKSKRIFEFQEKQRKEFLIREKMYEYVFLQSGGKNNISNSMYTDDYIDYYFE